MSLTSSAPVCETGAGSIPNDLDLLWKFKDYLDELCARTDIARTFKPRRYQLSDFVIVRFYAQVANLSTHHAAETLNATFTARLMVEGKFHRKVFQDGKRCRRVVPHQTDVDKFFRRLSERDVRTIFGGVLDAWVQEITAQVGTRRAWKFIADNTKFPYYGKRDPRKHIKAPHLPGTKHAWMFQGNSVVSEGIHLFVDFHSLTRGVYRCAAIPATIQWLEWAGISSGVALFDREFYRAALVHDLTAQGIPMLMPTKKHPWTLRRMAQYLHGTGGVVSGNVFTQSFKQYPNQSAAFVRLVLIGHDGKASWEVREQYAQGAFNFDEAIDKLAGFYTTLPPWKNEDAWARYLTRLYKRRWSVETGFRELNSLHPHLRCRTHVQKWADLFMRGWAYDLWQFWAFYHARRGYLPGNRTRQIFQVEAAGVVREILLASARKLIESS
jgi:hypothetical protein